MASKSTAGEEGGEEEKTRHPLWSPILQRVRTESDLITPPNCEPSQILPATLRRLDSKKAAIVKELNAASLEEGTPSAERCKEIILWILDARVQTWEIIKEYLHGPRYPFLHSMRVLDEENDHANSSMSRAFRTRNAAGTRYLMCCVTRFLPKKGWSRYRINGDTHLRFQLNAVVPYLCWPGEHRGTKFYLFMCNELPQRIESYLRSTVLPEVKSAIGVQLNYKKFHRRYVFDPMCSFLHVIFFENRRVFSSASMAFLAMSRASCRLEADSILVHALADGITGWDESKLRWMHKDLIDRKFSDQRVPVGTHPKYLGKWCDQKYKEIIIDGSDYEAWHMKHVHKR